MNSHEILLLNFLLYILTLIIYVKRKKSFDLGFVCLFMFALSSLGSIWYYSFDMVPYSYPDIRFTPLVFIYVLVLICFTPFLLLRVDRIQKLQTGVYDGIIQVLSVIFSIVSIPVFFNLVLNFGLRSFAGNALNSMYESDVDNANALFFSAVRPFFSILRRFYDLIVFLFYYSLIKAPGKFKTFSLIGLGMGISSFFIYAFQGGGRGGMVMCIIIAAGFYLLYYNLFNDKVRKTVRIIGIAVLCLLVLGIAAISISRFAANSTGGRVISQWIAQYLGEGMVRFSDVLWPVDEQLNGDKNFSYIKSLLGFDWIENNEKANLSYENRLGVPTSVFYTFIGSFYLDFNIVGTVIISILMFFFLYKICVKINRTKQIGFVESFILIKLFKLFATGFTSNVYAVTSTQKDEFVFWILIMMVCVFSKLQKQGFTPPPNG